jgi:uncharacterized repeat protein (TIGR01451 family)
VSNPPQAQIRVTKLSSAGAQALPPGGSVTYHVTVANVGIADASGTTVSDPLPNGIVSATWTCTGTNGAVCAANGTGAIQDTLSVFSPGGVATYTVTASVAAAPPPSVTNTVTVRPPNGSVCAPSNTPAPCTASATNPEVPQLELDNTSSAGPQRITPGGTVTYTVAVRNRGTLDVWGATLSNPLPVGIASARWTCSGTGGATCAASGSGAIADTLAHFPAGGVATYTITATVAALPPALVVDVATLVPPNESVCLPLSAASPCVVSAENAPVPQLLVQATGADHVQQNQPVTYTARFVNGGNVDASGTLATVALTLANWGHPTWTCVAANGAVCTPQGTGAINDTLTRFPPGASATYTFTGVALQGALQLTATGTPPANGVCLPNNTPGPCVANAQATIELIAAPALRDGGLGVLVLALVALGLWQRRRT